MGQLFIKWKPELQSSADMSPEGTHPLRGLARGHAHERETSRQGLQGARGIRVRELQRDGETPSRILVLSSEH